MPYYPLTVSTLPPLVLTHQHNANCQPIATTYLPQAPSIEAYLYMFPRLGYTNSPPTTSFSRSIVSFLTHWPPTTAIQILELPTRTSHLHSLAVGGEVERSQLFPPTVSLSHSLRLPYPHPSWASKYPLLPNLYSILITLALLVPTQCQSPLRLTTLSQTIALPLTTTCPVSIIFVLRTTFPSPMD